MRIVHVLSVLAIATGCSVDASPNFPETTPTTSTSGALTVQWTIVGSSEPVTCDAAAATAIDITILDSTGTNVVTRLQQSCNAFATSIALEQGIYAAQARLIGDGGAPRTSTVLIDFFTILGQSQWMQPVDFPKTSFLVQAE
jgi:hypothetical protein